MNKRLQKPPFLFTWHKIKVLWSYVNVDDELGFAVYTFDLN